MTKIEIKHLNTKHTDEIVDIFFAAFEQDPTMSYFFGERYQDLAPHVMRYMCNLADISNLLLMGAFIEEELRGVALVTPPDVVNVDKQEIAKLDEQLEIAVGEQVIVRLEEYFQIQEANKPKQAHFYLDILGVMPGSQGQGIGKTMMKALHQMSEESSQSCGVALDTENEHNLEFYQRLGYSVSTASNFAAITIWSMFRPNPV